MSAFKYFRKIDIVKHVKASEGLLSECSIGVPEQRKLKHGTGLASNDDGRPLTGGTNLIWMVVELMWLTGSLQVAVTIPAVCHDKVVNQHVAACSGSPHDG